MTHQFLLWFLFALFIVGMLILDLRVVHRSEHEVKMKEAVLWSVFWIALSLVFNLGIYFFQGAEPALNFLTGYLLEKSLSIDNLFVFILIFSYFKIEPKHQHKILFYGILGALLMRGLFIFGGIAVIERFHFVVYFFAAILIFSGAKLFFEHEKEVRPEHNPVIKIARKIYPAMSVFWITLLAIETTDVIFAADSVPAILAVTRDPFIVFSSNVFAIFGLRALYFVLARVMTLFRYLHFGLGLVLILIGAKMIAENFVHIPIGVTLSAIVVIISSSVFISIAKK